MARIKAANYYFHWFHLTFNSVHNSEPWQKITVTGQSLLLKEYLRYFKVIAK